MSISKHILPFSNQTIHCVGLVFLFCGTFMRFVFDFLLTMYFKRKTLDNRKQINTLYKFTNVIPTYFALNPSIKRYKYYPNTVFNNQIVLGKNFSDIS